MGEALAKADLHRLVDELPESEVLPAQRYLEFLRNRAMDPAILIHMNAPPDDEPLTDEDEAALEEALEEYRRGELISAEEIKRELLS